VSGPLRAALVGCGPRGEGHARPYAAIGAARLVACCDVDPERLEEFGDAFGIPRRFTDLERMLDELRPDLVHVVTPAHMRKPVVDAVLPFAPRAILLEKPIAVRPEEGYAILDGCARAGVPLFVNHQLRFLAPLPRLRALLEDGVLGELRLVRATTQWSLLEQGTHLFDLVSFLLGDDDPFETVVAQTTGMEADPRLPDAPGYCAGVVEGGDDLHVYFECGPGAPAWPGLDNAWHQLGIELVGSRGVAGLSLNRGWWCVADGVERGETWLHDDEDDPAQARLVESLVAALDADPTTHQSHARTAQLSFDLVAAIQRSALERRRVEVGERVADDEIDRLRELQRDDAVAAGVP